MNKALYLFSILILLSACGQHSHSHEAIALNKGEKWSVNAEMKPHIMEGEIILKEYIANGETDYQTLAKALEYQNSNLIKSCTMKGKSHDELHKWLHPHMELIAELDKAASIEDAGKVIAALETSFATFNTYFQ